MGTGVTGYNASVTSLGRVSLDENFPPELPYTESRVLPSGYHCIYCMCVGKAHTYVNRVRLKTNAFVDFIGTTEDIKNHYTGVYL